MTFAEYEDERKRILNESPNGIPSMQSLEDEYPGILILFDSLIFPMPETEGAMRPIEERFDDLVYRIRLLWFFYTSNKRQGEANLMLWGMERARCDELTGELDKMKEEYSKLAVKYHKLEQRND